MADIYVDSDKEVIKINGKCYYKVVGDQSYRTLTPSVIEDDFGTCRDCYEITTIKPGTTHIINGSIDNLRFKGGPGDRAILIFNDGLAIFNVEILNDNGSFVFDVGNVNGVTHTFGAPPELYAFTLGSTDHNLYFDRLGSFVFNVNFNLNSQTVAIGDSKTFNTSDPDLDALNTTGGSATICIPHKSTTTPVCYTVTNGDTGGDGTLLDTKDKLLNELVNLIRSGGGDTGCDAKIIDGKLIIYTVAPPHHTPVGCTLEVTAPGGVTKLITITEEPFLDTDKDGIPDFLDPDPYGLIGARINGFDSTNIPSKFGGPTDFIKVCISGFCYESLQPPTTVDNAFEELVSLINSDMTQTGIRAIYETDGSNKFLKVWYPANNKKQPSLSVQYSIASINNGIRTGGIDNKDLTDFNKNGIPDGDELDPYGIGDPTNTPFKLDDQELDDFPESSDDTIEVCVQSRCYSSNTPATTKEQALKDIAKKIQEDFKVGLIDFTATYNEENKDLLILDPLTGLAPQPITCVIRKGDGSEDTLSGGTPSSELDLEELQISGFTSPAGVNGKFTKDGNFKGSKPTYSNGDGWYLFWDGSQWVLTDTAYDKTGKFIEGGSKITDPFGGTGKASSGFPVANPPTVTYGGVVIDDVTIAGLADEYISANGTYIYDSNSVNKRPAYTMGAWYLWWDGHTWVISNRAYDKNDKWLTNGSSEPTEGNFSLGIKIAGFTGDKTNANGWYRDTGKKNLLGATIYENEHGYRMLFDPERGGWVIEFGPPPNNSWIGSGNKENPPAAGGKFFLDSGVGGPAGGGTNDWIGKGEGTIEDDLEGGSGYGTTPERIVYIRYGLTGPLDPNIPHVTDIITDINKVNTVLNPPVVSPPPDLTGMSSSQSSSSSSQSSSSSSQSSSSSSKSSKSSSSSDSSKSSSSISSSQSSSSSSSVSSSQSSSKSSSSKSSSSSQSSSKSSSSKSSSSKSSSSKSSSSKSSSSKSSSSKSSSSESSSSQSSSSSNSSSSKSSSSVSSSKSSSSISSSKSSSLSSSKSSSSLSSSKSSSSVSSSKSSSKSSSSSNSSKSSGSSVSSSSSSKTPVYNLTLVAGSTNSVAYSYGVTCKFTSYPPSWGTPTAADLTALPNRTSMPMQTGESVGIQTFHSLQDQVHREWRRIGGSIFVLNSTPDPTWLANNPQYTTYAYFGNFLDGSTTFTMGYADVSLNASSAILKEISLTTIQSSDDDNASNAVYDTLQPLGSIEFNGTAINGSTGNIIGPDYNDDNVAPYGPDISIKAPSGNGVTFHSWTSNNYPYLEWSGLYTQSRFRDQFVSPTTYQTADAVFSVNTSGWEASAVIGRTSVAPAYNDGKLFTINGSTKRFMYRPDYEAFGGEYDQVYSFTLDSLWQAPQMTYAGDPDNYGDNQFFHIQGYSGDQTLDYSNPDSYITGSGGTQIPVIHLYSEITTGDYTWEPYYDANSARWIPMWKHSAFLGDTTTAIEDQVWIGPAKYDWSKSDPFQGSRYTINFTYTGTRKNSTVYNNSVAQEVWAPPTSAYAITYNIPRKTKANVAYFNINHFNPTDSILTMKTGNVVAATRPVTVTPLHSNPGSTTHLKDPVVSNVQFLSDVYSGSTK